MDNIDLDKIFSQIVQSYNSQAKINYKDIHLLAESHHLGAKIFFIEHLDELDDFLRHMFLISLGFHYDLSTNTDVIDKIRNLALTDKDEVIRMSSISILASQLKTVDNAIIYVLDNDLDEDVKRKAFEEILLLYGISYNLVSKYSDLIKSGNLYPNLDNVKNILLEHNISADFL